MKEKKKKENTICKSYVVSYEHTIQTDADKKHGVFPLAYPKSGPHWSRRYRANLAAADYTHSVQKDTKPSAKPFLSMGDTLKGKTLPTKGWHASREGVCVVDVGLL